MMAVTLMLHSNFELSIRYYQTKIYFMLPIKTTLLINAISSGVTGIGLVIFAKEAAQLFGVSMHAPFTYTGLFLVGFALFVLAAAFRKTISRSAVRLITTLDILWVVVSVLLVVADG